MDLLGEGVGKEHVVVEYEAGFVVRVAVSLILIYHLVAGAQGDGCYDKREEACGYVVTFFHRLEMWMIGVCVMVSLSWAPRRGGGRDVRGGLPRGEGGGSAGRYGEAGGKTGSWLALGVEVRCGRPQAAGVVGFTGISGGGERFGSAGLAAIRLVGLIGLIRLISLIGPISLVGLISPIGLIRLIGLMGQHRTLPD